MRNKQKNVQSSWSATRGIETSAVLTVILACGKLGWWRRVKAAETGVRTRDYKQLAHHIFTGERLTLVDVVVNETGSDESKRLIGRADT